MEEGKGKVGFPTQGEAGEDAIVLFASIHPSFSWKQLPHCPWEPNTLTFTP